MITNTKPEMYQSVILTLNDGRKGRFLGPALVFKKDKGVKTVVDVQFTEPKPMPNGMSFEVIK